MFLKIPINRHPSKNLRIDSKNSIARGLLVAATPFSPMLNPGIRYIGKTGICVRGATLCQPFVSAGVANSTVLIIDNAVAADGGNYWIATDRVYADTNSVWPNDTGLQVHSTTLYGIMSVVARDTGGTIRKADVDVTPAGNFNTIGQMLVRAATVDANLLVTGWGNGQKIGTSTALQGFSYNPPVSGNVLFGVEGASLGDTVTAQSLALRWNRVLSDAELTKIMANPWRLYKPRTLVYSSLPSVQYARPIADLSNTGWAPSTGADLYPMVGETVRDDGTYIAATAVGALCELDLADLADPAVSTGHLPTLVLSAPGGGGITVRLRQGTTTIAEWTYHPGASPTEVTPTLSAPEADSITDYTALRLQFEAIA